MKLLLGKTIVAFRSVVFVYAVALILFPLLPALGQRRILPPAQDFDLSELGHRLDAVERLDLERRLTVLETIQTETKEDAMWHKGSSVGTGLLLIEAVSRVARRKKTPQE